jgi:hypothetical protein
MFNWLKSIFSALAGGTSRDEEDQDKTPLTYGDDLETLGRWLRRAKSTLARYEKDPDLPQRFVKLQAEYVRTLQRAYDQKVEALQRRRESDRKDAA